MKIIIENYEMTVLSEDCNDPSFRVRLSRPERDGWVESMTSIPSFDDCFGPPVKISLLDRIYFNASMHHAVIPMWLAKRMHAAKVF